MANPPDQANSSLRSATKAVHTKRLRNYSGSAHTHDVWQDLLPASAIASFTCRWLSVQQAISLLFTVTALTPFMFGVHLYQRHSLPVVVIVIGVSSGGHL